MKLLTGTALAAAMVLTAASASAGEFRLGDAEMDSVTAGVTLIGNDTTATQIGAGTTLNGNDFGPFEPVELGGQQNPLAPPPPPPAFGGFNFGGFLGSLLGGFFGR